MASLRSKLARGVLIALLALVAIFAPECALAQTGGGGSIQGTITDSGGSVVAGATVVATNVATGVGATRQTNEAGLYVISPLPPGEYKVSVSAPGFTQNFQIRENLRFVFGADSFNLFNNVRLGSINTNITNANFGRAAAQVNLPRVFQFKARIEF